MPTEAHKKGAHEAVSSSGGKHASEPGGGTGFEAALFGIGVVAAVLLIGVLAVAVADTSAGLEPGAQAPDFTLETFEGDRISLSELRGKVVVVNFWASWCETCDQEAADLEAIWREYRGRGVVFLGIDYTDTRSAALEYLDRFGITYPNGPDKADMISRRYRLSGVPETVVVDTAGRLVPLRTTGSTAVGLAKLTGPITVDGPFTPDDLRVLLEQLIETEPEGQAEQSEGAAASHVTDRRPESEADQPMASDQADA